MSDEPAINRDHSHVLFLASTGKLEKQVLLILLLVRVLDRKARFWVGFLLVVFIYSFPIVGLFVVGAFLYLAVIVASFIFSIYLVYRTTIRNIKPKYPIVNPEGRPDIYSGRMPRPIYEDMEQYPWFFHKNKKKRERAEKKRFKKKN